MIKAIVFDFGNVLITADYTLFIDALVPACTITAEEMTKIIFSSEIIQFLDTDLVSFDEFYRFFQDQCGLTMDKDTFQKHYLNCTPVPETVELVNTLKKSGKYKLGLLSNMSLMAYQNTFKNLACADAFDVEICSYQFNIRKPNPLLYEELLENFDCTPGEIVYLDDKEENLGPAKDLGIITIYYTSHEQLLEEFKKLNISF